MQRTRFFAVHEKITDSIALRLDALDRACRHRDISFVTMDALAIDYSAIPILGHRDMVYRVGRGGHVLENLLLNVGVASFHSDPRHIELNLLDTTTIWSLVYERIGLPVPKTIHSLSASRTLLDKYVGILGGFPVVLKVAGGTLDLGTIRVDSRASLYSTADYLLTNSAQVSMREFIGNCATVRLVVVGDEVVASIRYDLPEGDFRSNASQIIRGEPFVPTAPMVTDAVRAVHAANLRAGAVDMLCDSVGVHKILEMNFPFGFAVVDAQAVAGAMVDYLRGN